MADLAIVKQKVQAYLTSEGPVQIDSRGVFSFRQGSTMAFIEVAEHPNGKATIVTVSAPVAWEVPASPELFEHVAREGGNYFFGHLALWDDPDVPGTVSMSLRHTLLGDFLDKDETLYAAYGVAGSADEIDDQIVAKFGGHVQIKE